MLKKTTCLQNGIPEKPFKIGISGRFRGQKSDSFERVLYYYKAKYFLYARKVILTCHSAKQNKTRAASKQALGCYLFIFSGLSVIPAI